MESKDCQYLVTKSNKHYCKITGDYCVAASGETYRDGPWFRERTIIDTSALVRCPARRTSEGLATMIKQELVQIQVSDLKAKHEQEIRSLQER